MLKKFLFWITRFGKGPVIIWLKPFNTMYDCGGKIVFLNTLLRFLNEEQFAGFSHLRKLSACFNRPICIWITLHEERLTPELVYAGEIRKNSTDRELEKITEFANHKAGSFLIMPGNINLPVEIKPKFFV
jgi:hypothetical protein